jgi:acetone carboxylase gamma subunit
MYICNECGHDYDSAAEAGECEILDIEDESLYQEWLAEETEYAALLTDDEFEAYYEEAL